MLKSRVWKTLSSAQYIEDLSAIITIIIIITITIIIIILVAFSMSMGWVAQLYKLCSPTQSVESSVLKHTSLRMVMMMMEIIYDGEVDIDDEGAGNDDDFGHNVNVLARKS